MAQILLINERSLADKDDRQIGDVVGIYEDNHRFSILEEHIFDIVQVPETKKELEAMRPKCRAVYRAKSDGWQMEPPEEKEAWEDPVDGSLKEVVKRPRLDCRYEKAVTKDGEKTVLKENYSRLAENTSKTLVTAERNIETKESG